MQGFESLQSFLIYEGEIIVKFILIFFLASLIGLEREYKGKPAGLRTHILIGLGSCAIIILSLRYIDEHPDAKLDLLRSVGSIISGIGFLGAGTIMKTGLSAKGLTNAANIWAVAILGIIVGLGYYITAIIYWIIILITLFVLSKFKTNLSGTRKDFELELEFGTEILPYENLNTFLLEREIIVEKRSISSDKTSICVTIRGKIKEKYSEQLLTQELSEKFELESYSLKML